MTWLAETRSNLKNLRAFKGMLANIKSNWRQWVLNELAPSSYTNPDGMLHWANLKAEVVGWSKHVFIGFVLTDFVQFFGVSTNAVFAWAIAIPFVVEIIQFLKSRAAFINPLNSLLDIAFYVSGTTLFYGVSQWLR